MHWNDGLKDPTLFWSVILPANEGILRIRTLNTFSRLVQSLRDKVQTAKDATEWEMMDWYELHQKLPRGRLKKQPKMRPVSLGQRRVMHEGLDPGSWNE